MAVREELAWFAAFLEAFPDGVAVVAEDGVILAANAQLAEMTGYTHAELVDEPVEMLVPTSSAPTHSAHRHDYFAAARSRPMGTGLDIRVRRKDGTEFPADIALSPLAMGGVRMAIASVRDITERHRQQQMIEAALAVAQAILGGEAGHEALVTVAHRATELVQAALGMVVVPRAGGELVVEVAEGPTAESVAGLVIPAAEWSVSRQVMADREALVVDDARQDSRVNPRGVATAGMGPMLVVPLAVRSEAFGTLVVGNEPGGPLFTAADLEAMKFFAAQAAVALEYSKIQTELQRLALVDERERIGRELHDGAIQSIFAVGMSLEGLSTRTPDGELADRIRDAVRQLDDVIRDLRSYIYGLRPTLVAQQQLVEALQQLVLDFEASSGVTAVADIDRQAAEALSARAGDVVLLAGEALSNVGKHAQALTCRLSLRLEGGEAVLEVEDDGEGFDVGRTRAGGQGLINLRDRAVKLGGAAQIESTPGDGTRVVFRLPI